VALVGSDGVVRSAGGGAVPRLSLGQNLSGSKQFGHITTGSSTVFQDAGASGDDSLIVTAKRVRGYPLWVTVSTKESDIYKSSWSDLQRNAIVVAILTILILFALEQILRAEARAAQKAGQLQLTLEHISQGIMLVTKDRQIPIINQRCAELLCLPKEMIEAPPTFDDLSRYEAESGHIHLPSVAESMPPKSEGSTHAPLEPSISDYQRQDGVFIEVRKTELPDGGFVQTFTDITRRREAEASIVRL